MALQVQELRLEQLFSEAFLLRIPDFQREYVWETEQAMQLLDDIAEACTRGRSTYFLGSLVLVGSEESGATWDVIDGQQRITTLMLLLASLRDLEDDDQFRESLDYRLNDPGDPVVGRKASPRLVLRELDREFVRTYVQEGSVEELFALSYEDTSTHAQRRMIENTRAFYDYLDATYDSAERRQIARYLLREVAVVMVGSSDYADAYRMFHVLNDRGIPLGPSDILKARVVSSINADLQAEYAQKWDAITETHGPDFEEFLRNIFIVEQGEPLAGDLIDDFPEKLLAAYEPDRNDEFIEHVLLPYSAIYERIRRPDSRNEKPEVWEELNLLSQYNSREWHAAAMWILRNLDDNPQRQAELLRDLERVIGIDALAHTAHSQRVGRIVQIIRDLKDGTPPTQIFGVSDELRTKAVSNLRGAFATNSPLAKIVLQRANAQAEGLASLPTRRALNAVRVIPSKDPSLKWAGLSPSQQNYWYDRLANIVLTSARPANLRSSSDYSTRRKKILGVGDAYVLTSQLQDLPEWTDDVLNERQTAIVRSICDYWSIRQDSEGIDLTAVEEDRLLLGSRASARGGRQVKNIDLLRVGLIHEGDVFVWERPRLGNSYRVTITAEGRFALEDGTIETSASAAARSVSGTSQSGLKVWRREADGKSLGELNESYLQRA